jgi:hypothetical protein
MEKYISMKKLYSHIKQVSDDVQNGDTYTVVKYSHPICKIIPFHAKQESSSYSLKDVEKFIFTSTNKEENLATQYKKYIY